MEFIIKSRKKMMFLVVPVALSCLFTFERSFLILAAFVLSHFVILRLVPAFKRRENLWMFLMVTLSSVPINIYILKTMYLEKIFLNETFLMTLLRGIIVYLICFSVEQVVMGLITRVIWRDQYRISLG